MPLSPQPLFLEMPNTPPKKIPNIEKRSREYLFDHEIWKLLETARKFKSLRNELLILLSYRHGLRVSEAVNLKWQQIDWETASIHITRLKGGKPSTHPLKEDELRRLRLLKKQNPTSPHLFLSSRGTPLSAAAAGGIIRKLGEQANLELSIHPHMLRHSCGYALAAKGIDTRAIQDYLGHRNIQHTVTYTQLAPDRFQDFWN